MTDQEFIQLRIDKLNPEQARITAVDILKEDIAADRAAVKRNGIISGLLAAGMLITGMNNIPSYAIMGVDSMFIFAFFQKLQALQQKKKQLKQFETGTYPGGAKEFLHQCQDYVRSKYKYVPMPEQPIVEEPIVEEKHKPKKGKGKK